MLYWYVYDSIIAVASQPQRPYLQARQWHYRIHKWPCTIPCHSCPGNADAEKWQFPHCCPNREKKWGNNMSERRLQYLITVKHKHINVKSHSFIYILNHHFLQLSIKATFPFQMHHKMSIFEAISTVEGVAKHDTQMAMHHSVSQVPRPC